MHLLKLLEELTDAHKPVVGGKAVSLGKMIRAGFNVPGGFVIAAQASHRYHEHPQEFSQELYDAFEQLGADKVAVRSSAIDEDSREASWAGQFDTFLNVDRHVLLESVQGCWKSVHSNRVAAYAQQHGAAGKDRDIAVIIQRMVQSVVSGVAFSVHPVTGNPDHTIIEAGLGLGEAMVSGQITPDTYVINKRTNEIVSKQVAQQTKALVDTGWQPLGSEGMLQKLSDLRIVELVGIVRRIENYYNFPVDVEWTLDEAAIFIVQARPITTMFN